MATLTYDIKAEFSAGVWTSIKADALTRTPLEWSGGCGGPDPLSVRVAGTGTLTFALDNSAKNSGSKIGYYAPDHANCRAGWGLGTAVRVETTHSGTTRYKKYYVSDISPYPGQYRDRYVSVTCVDYMDTLASKKISGLAVQFGQTSETLYAAIVAAMPTAPVDTDWDSGVDTFAYAFHDLKDERTVGMTAISKVAMSGLEYVYLCGDTTAGELLKSQSRHTRMLTTTPAADLDNSMVDMSVTYSKAQTVNRVRVTAHPVQVDSAPTTILATLQREIQIGASQTLDPIIFRYRDPNGAATRIAGYDIVTPVSGTNYRMSTYSGGTGNDLGANLTMTVTDQGNNASVVFENTVAARGFINYADIVGRGVYAYDPVDMYADDESDGTAELSIDCPYLDEPDIAQDFADWIIGFDPPIIDSVTFCANRSDTLMGYGCALEVGNRVTITETVTGVDTDYFVNHITRRIEAGGIMYVTLGALEPCEDVGDWLILDHATAGNLDQEKLGV